eukprot:jgi/Orpsp1_1/1177452/evm.model.c7180000061479.1
MKLRTPLAILISLLVSKIEVSAKPTQINNGTDLSLENQSFSNGEQLMKKGNAGLQAIKDISYTESLSEIYNPYRGFYKEMKIVLKRNGKSTSGYIESNQFLRILVDISNYQNHNLDDTALKFLRNILEEFRSNHKTIVIRFAYHDYSSNSPTHEPSNMGIVEGHQESLGKILKEYDDVIASVECGLFGKWGEMHSSDVYRTNSERTYVRSAEFYSNWSGVNRSKISKNITKPDQQAFRIGLYNDGYLGSPTDLGTYKNRNEEINWLFNQSNHTLFGGEFGGYEDTEDWGNVKPTVEYMSIEAFKTHTSYLNIDHSESIIDGMKKESYSGSDSRYKGQTGFTYIENHLGYRFVVRGVRLTKNAYKNNKFGIEVDIENVGFATLIKPKTVSFVVVDSKGNSNILSMKNVNDGNPNLWYSREKHTLKGKVTLPSNLSTGNCKIYLRIGSTTKLGLDDYPIQFANDDKNIWDSKLGANYLGTFTLNNDSE